MTDGPDSLDALEQQVDALGERHAYASQWPLLQELRLRARRDKDFRRTVRALFMTANSSHQTLTPERQRDASVELVTLLESQEAADRLEPGLAEDEFALCRHWYTSCAYDNLAVSIAALEGYNSEGMHETVSEGIAKCRETGKTSCIVCFREYACDISMASDDLELAARQARALALRPVDQATHDRRVVGRRTLARVELLMGRLEAARESLIEAFEPAAEYFDADLMARSIHRDLATIYLLLDDREGLAELRRERPPPKGPARGESTAEDRDEDQLEALEACLDGDWERACEIQRRLVKQAEALKHRPAWLESRLRLAAMLALSGAPTDTGELERVLAETRLTAEGCRDWLTLRRLDAITDPAIRTSPVATVATLSAGPWGDPDGASEAERAGEDDAVKAENESTESRESTEKTESTESGADAAESQAPGPLETLADGWRTRFAAAVSEPETVVELAGELAAELQTIPVGTIDTANEARAFCLMAYWVAEEGVEASRMWRLSKLVARRFEASAPVLSMHAGMAALMERTDLLPAEQRPSEAEVEDLYRRAMALDIHDEGIYYGAGRYFLSRGRERFGEAERCFARAFRLARTWSLPALNLAEIYRVTERPRDALEVLDLAVRHGCPDPRVAFEAGLAAFGLGLWRRGRMAFRYCHELDPEARWCHYYQAVCLLELGEAEEALEHIREEPGANPGIGIGARAVEVAALAALDRREEAIAGLRQALREPLFETTVMNRSGILRALLRLREVAVELAADEGEGEDVRELLAAVERRAWRSAHVDESWFPERDGEDEDVGVYVVSLFFAEVMAEDDPDRPADQRDWPGWEDLFVVVAADGAAAVELARAEVSARLGQTPAHARVEPLYARRFEDAAGLVDQLPRRRWDGEEPEEDTPEPSFE